MMSVHHRGRKTPSTGGQDSQSKDCFLSRKCEVRISSQHSAHMHLYTNVSSWVLSILLSETTKSQLFLLHSEPVLPSWTSEATTTLPTNLKNTSEQLAQLEQALNSVPSALSFTFGTHSTTLSHHLPQMHSLSPRDAIKHCLRSPQASDPRLPNTQAQAKPTCVQLAQETKRCLLHAWIRSTCNHLQLHLRVSTCWLPAHHSSTTSDHQLDSIDRGSQAIWELWRSTAHRSSVSCEQERRPWDGGTCGQRLRAERTGERDHCDPRWSLLGCREVLATVQPFVLMWFISLLCTTRSTCWGTGIKKNNLNWASNKQQKQKKDQFLLNSFQ